jgi:toxin FitB
MIRRNPQSQNSRRSLALWLSTLHRSFEDRILPIDHAVADEWGRMSAKRSVPTVDALLAATAKVHGMTLAPGIPRMSLIWSLRGQSL